MWHYSEEPGCERTGLGSGLRSLLKKPELGMPSAPASPMPGSPVPTFRNPESLPPELTKPEGSVVLRSGVVAFWPLAALTIGFGGLVKAGVSGAWLNMSEFAKPGLKPPALPPAGFRTLGLRFAAFNPPVTLPGLRRLVPGLGAANPGPASPGFPKPAFMAPLTVLNEPECPMPTFPVPELKRPMFPVAEFPTPMLPLPQFKP